MHFYFCNMAVITSIGEALALTVRALAQLVTQREECGISSTAGGRINIKISSYQYRKSPYGEHGEHIWDSLGCAITSMDNSPQNLGELRQALLGKWAEIPVEPLHCLVAKMPRCLAAIISAGGGNTRYWPGIHKTTATSSIMRKIMFVCPDLLQLTSNDILVCSCSQCFLYQ